MTIREVDNYTVFCNKITELYHSGCKDKQKFAEYLNLATPVLNKLHDDSINSFGMQLQIHMNSSRNMALNHANNKAVRMLFGLQYMFNEAYVKVKELGIGSLLHFYVSGRTIKAEIALELGLHKEENETNEEFKVRNDAFIKSSPYTYQKAKYGNWLNIMDTEKNRQLLHTQLKNIFAYDTFKISSCKDTLDKIVLYVNGIIDISNVQKETKTNDGDIYMVFKASKQIMDAIQTLRMVYTDEIANTTQHLCALQYYDICKLLGVENDFTKEFAALNFANRHKNMETHELIKEIGSRVPFDEIIQTGNDIMDNFEKQMEEEYCAFSTTQIDRYGLIAEIGFSSMFHSKRKYKLDEFKEETYSEYEYSVDGTKLKEISSVFMKDGIDITKASVKLADDKILVDKLKAIVMDYTRLMNLLEKSKTEE